MNQYRTWKKQLYGELATLVYESYHQGRLASEEMFCLLEILEAVVNRRESCPLIPYLHRWMTIKPEKPEQLEISEIIRATLINADFADPSSLAQTAEIVASLVDELEKT